MSDDYTLLHGDCLTEMAAMDAGSVDAVVCDPPYGLEFMGKEWDKLESRPDGNPALKPKKQHIKATAPGQWQPGRTYGAPKKNPRCRNCGALKFTNPAGNRKHCLCPEPDWDTRQYEYAQQMQAWHQAWATEALRVLKPSHYLLAFGGTRTWHRLACAIEDAGFEIRDTLMWLYGSGFPKGKSCLKPAWEPVILARKPGPMRELGIESCRITAGGRADDSSPESSPGTLRGIAGLLRLDSTVDTFPSRSADDPGDTSLADARCGETLRRSLASALQREDFVSKALGSLDGCPSCHHSGGELLRRVQEAAQASPASLADALERTDLDRQELTRNPSNQCTCRPSSADALGLISSLCDLLSSYYTPSPVPGNPSGRWPANLVLECTCDETREGTVKTGTAGTRTGQNGVGNWGYSAAYGPWGSYAGPGGKEPVRIHTDPNCPCAMLDGQTGSVKGAVSNGRRGVQGVYEDGIGASAQLPSYADSGGASRFFYCAKASRSERNAGCEGMEEREAGVKNASGRGFSERDPYAKIMRQNHHPTVKPLALMRWLVKLVARPGDVVLDPFMGSGTTGVACAMEGREFIGIEQDSEYVEIARRRIAHASAQGRLPLDESPPLPPVAGRPT